VCAKDKKTLSIALSIVGYFITLIVGLFVNQLFAILFGTVGALMMVLWFLVLDLLLD